MARISLAAVVKEFGGGVRAVDGVDLEVADQEFLVIVGPSGSGKTTLLRLIAGLDQVTRGTIRLDGRVVNDVPPRERNVAVVFQSGALFPHMTVYQNMALGLELRSRTNPLARIWGRIAQPARARQNAACRAEIPSRVRETATALGITDLLARRPSELSGGQRQRVALGKAIVRCPGACLLDEPLSSLDAGLRAEMRRELKRLHQRVAGTMVLVTHDQVEAAALGDRVAVLDRGRLQQVGTPAELYARPANRFVAGFIGVPAMNFCSGQIRRDATGEVRFHAACWSVPLDTAWQVDRPGDGRAILGIRPSDVGIAAESNPESPTGIRAIVALIEPQGDALLVHLDMQTSDRGGSESAATEWIVAKVDSRQTLRVGERVTATMDVTRACLFDPETGVRVAPVDRAY